MESEKIIIFGAGYVGLVASCCFASAGYEVSVIEPATDKLEKIKKGECPFYEPGLSELLKNGITKNKLSFYKNANEAFSNKEATFVFCAVGTPERSDGSANLDYVRSALTEAVKNSKAPFIFILKSTVPVGTARTLQKEAEALAPGKVEVVNNPEFLREGTAVNDFLRPERVVVGGRPEATMKVEKLYSSFLLSGKPVIKTDSTSAELGKLAANLMLASRISVLNQVARLSAATHSNIRHIEKILQTDSRIGSKYLYSGLGFGGSCFPKDIQSFIHLCKENNVDASVASAIDSFNDSQKLFFIPSIQKTFPDAKNTSISLLGLAFKPETDDIRESPALAIAAALCKLGYKLKVYDPQALDTFKNWAKQNSLSNIEFSNSSEECLKHANAMILVTEWQEFQRISAEKLKKIFSGTHVYDGKNVLVAQDYKNVGYQYMGIGQS